jgi:hypothetical protein
MGMLEALALIVMVLVAAPAAWGCALAYEDGPQRPRIAREEALIVWDAGLKVEHFIRTVHFGGGTKSFAFLVPTPGRPTLAKADERVFERLAVLYRRPPMRTASAIAIVDGDDPSPAAVTVVERKRVAGLDAVVLLATDAAALATWLREHHFARRADLDAWLAPYVARGFYLTAFRYERGGHERVRSSAVRLSFACEQPFYPYAEPKDAGGDETRSFRLTVVAPWRAAGKEGDHAWEAAPAYADRPRRLATTLGATVPGAPRAGPWVTTFQEYRGRRGSADLVFAAAAEQQPVPPSVREDE